MKTLLLAIFTILFLSTNSFSENLLPVYITNIPVDTYGVELITNGDFGTSGSWNNSGGSGWSISGGTANAVDAPNLNYYIQGLGVPGKIYHTVFDIVSLTSGAVATRSSGATGTYRTSIGTYTQDLLSVSVGGFGVVTQGVTNASVDNVSIKIAQYAINTKSYYEIANLTWRQNITGATISGDTAGVLSIISGPGTNGKAYQIANTGSVDVVVILTPSEALVVGRHYRPSVIAKRTVGTGTPTYKLTGGTAVSITSSTFTPLAAPAVATNTTDKPTFTVPAGCTIQFYLPKLTPILSAGGNFRDFNFSFQY